MEELFIAKGQDKEFEFNIKDSAGTAINLTTGIERLFIVFHYLDGTILDKFARPSQSGWKDLTGSGAQFTAGRCYARLLTSVTGPAKEGKIYVETRVKTTNTDSPDDNQADYIKREQYICTIKNSVTSGMTLP